MPEIDRTLIVDENYENWDDVWWEEEERLRQQLSELREAQQQTLSDLLHVKEQRLFEPLRSEPAWAYFRVQWVPYPPTHCPFKKIIETKIGHKELVQELMHGEVVEEIHSVVYRRIA
jgi:hypothetical protein